MPYDSPFSAVQQRPDQTTLVANEATDATAGPKAVGQFFFAASAFPAGTLFFFEGVASVSNGGITGSIVLYNVTDGETVAVHATSATTPTAFSSALTVGVGVGELKPTVKTYEVRLAVTGALVTDIVTLGSARLLKR